MKVKKDQELLNDINKILDESITSEERVYLLEAKKALEKKQYLPKISNNLKWDLTPLAISQKMSKPVQPLYLKITSNKYIDKGFGHGLSSVFTIGGQP